MAKKKLTKDEFRRIFILAAILLVVSLTVYNIVHIKEVKQEAMMSKMQQQKSTGEALIGGDFTMTDQNGKRVSFSNSNGKLRLVFFGFTHCPDICPVSLLTLSNAMHSLGDETTQVQPIFISVDPKRDTPAVMKDYLSNFDASIIGLTGNEEELKKAAAEYKAYYADSHDEAHEHQEGHMKNMDHGNDDYAVNHSGFIYLMDRDGTYLEHFPYDVSEKKLLDALQSYLK